MKNTIYIALCVICFTLVVSCEDKVETAFPGRISVRLHDMPENYDSVLVEVTGVRVHVEGNGWIDLNTNSGIYDLLEFQDGVDTLLVPLTVIPSGLISQIRLILGTNNTLYIAGDPYPLGISSQDETGLKLNVHEYLEENDEAVLSLDFDVAQSIQQNGNGGFKLKPVVSASFQ